MTIPFLYPPGNYDILTEKGRISFIRHEREPYELSVDFRGWNYHIIFGTQKNGHFLCVPRLHIGAELAQYDDILWNTKSLRGAGLSYELALMFAQVMAEVQDYIS